jgi:hypothetical protein
VTAVCPALWCTTVFSVVTHRSIAIVSRRFQGTLSSSSTSRLLTCKMKALRSFKTSAINNLALQGTETFKCCDVL